MKRLTISKLMDEYTDTEFFPTGGRAADPEAVKGWVMANVRTPAGKGPAKKKQAPRKKKLLLAAALASVMVVLMGAGFPSMIYGLVSGQLRFEETDNGRITAVVHYTLPLQVEEGRLWFAPDEGERIDVTDLVSEDTPYIYDGSDPSANQTYYVIMGGTPEQYGYFEWIMTPDPFDRSGERNMVYMDGERMYATYAYTIHGPGGEDDIAGGGIDFGAVFWEDVKDYAWLRAGIEELGIPITTEQNYTVIHEQ